MLYDLCQLLSDLLEDAFFVFVNFVRKWHSRKKIYVSQFLSE